MFQNIPLYGYSVIYLALKFTSCQASVVMPLVAPHTVPGLPHALWFHKGELPV